MSNEIVLVPFHGDVIEATKDGRGVWVPLRRPCEALGIDPDGQRRKLQGKPWAVTEMISATGPDGKLYEMFALHLDCLPMWLATIDAKRVKEEMRPKLELYQREAAKVLADHFFGRKERPAGSPLQMLRLMVDEMEAQEQRLAAVETTVGTLVAVREQATAELEHVERSALPAPPLSLRDRVNQLVRAYCTATSTGHPDVWKRLYRELFYRCDINAQVRAKNSGRRALDEVEAAGAMPDLYAIASETLVF